MKLIKVTEEEKVIEIKIIEIINTPEVMRNYLSSLAFMIENIEAGKSRVQNNTAKTTTTTRLIITKMATINTIQTGEM